MHTIAIQMTGEEALQLQTAAAEAELTHTAYIKACVFGDAQSATQIDVEKRLRSMEKLLGDLNDDVESLVRSGMTLASRAHTHAESESCKPASSDTA